MTRLNRNSTVLAVASVVGLTTACDLPERDDDEPGVADRSVAVTTPADDLFVAGEYGESIAGNVLDNDTAGDGFYDPAAVAVVPPRYGTLTGLGAQLYGGITPWGQFEYEPAPGFSGVDTFAYRVLNGGQPSRVVTVFVAVGDVQIASADEPGVALGAASADNRTPVIASDNVVAAGQYWRLVPGLGGRARHIRTLASGGRPGQLKFIETWQPGGAGNEVTIYPQNGRRWQDFTFESAGDSSFRITSEYTGKHLGRVGDGGPTLAVGAVDDGQALWSRWLLHAPGQAPAPRVYDDQASTAVDTAVVGSVRSNDVATGADYLSVVATAPEHGALVGLGGLLYGGVTPWGEFEYEPEPGFEGTDSFTYYALTSADGAPSAVATVTITVGAP